MDKTLEAAIIDCIEAIKDNGLNKVEFDNGKYSIKCYRVGKIIRLDFKEES